MARRFYKLKAIQCHICSLPFLDSIVYRDHPLFPTIDHVIPRCKGGSDVADNRKPAHRYCNERKGGMELTAEMGEEFRIALTRSFPHLQVVASASHTISPPREDISPEIIEEIPGQVTRNIAAMLRKGGATHAEIALKMGISVGGVKYHVKKINKIMLDATKRPAVIEKRDAVAV